MSADTINQGLFDILTDIYGRLRHGAKRLAEEADGRSHRTAENWLQMRNSMPAANLIQLMASNDEIAAEILRLVQEAKCGK